VIETYVGMSESLFGSLFLHSSRKKKGKIAFVIILLARFYFFVETSFSLYSEKERKECV
jgi:hypothetical protein